MPQTRDGNDSEQLILRSNECKTPTRLKLLQSGLWSGVRARASLDLYAQFTFIHFLVRLNQD